MKKIIFFVGSSFFSLILYFFILWTSLFHSFANREKAIMEFYSQTPNFINNSIGIDVLGLILGLISVACFYFLVKKDFLKKISLILMIFSGLITVWYLWILL